MTNDQEKEFLQFLKSSGETKRDRELDAVMSAMEVMATNLHSLVPEHGAVFTSTVERMKSTVRSQRALRYGVQEYFSGNGPIARKLKEHAAIAHYLGVGDIEQLTAALTNRLRDFDYAPSSAPERRANLEGFIMEKIIPMVYQATRPRPVASIGEIHINTDTNSGFYLVEKPGFPDRNALVLSTTLPGRDSNASDPVRLLMVAISDVKLQMFYWHPQESEWVASDLQVLLPFTVEALENEYARVMEAFKEAIPEPLDWTQQLEELQAKATRVFAQQDLLPTSYLTYFREGDASQIIHQHEAYGIVFRDTRGAYPSQSTSLLQYYGMIPNAVPLEKIPDEVKYKLWRTASYDLDNLQEHIDATQRRRLQQTACQNQTA